MLAYKCTYTGQLNPVLKWPRTPHRNDRQFRVNNNVLIVKLSFFNLLHSYCILLPVTGIRHITFIRNEVISLIKSAFTSVGFLNSFNFNSYQNSLALQLKVQHVFRQDTYFFFITNNVKMRSSDYRLPLLRILRFLDTDLCIFLYYTLLRNAFWETSRLSLKKDLTTGTND